MRAIKFRQPRFDDKGKFIDWFYWGFIDNGFTAPLKHDVDNYQFIGLLDKHGKEIYEGDIVTCAPNEGPGRTQMGESTLEGPFVVGFKNGSFCIEWNESKWCIRHFPKITLIGNIHESPELLDGQD